MTISSRSIKRSSVGDSGDTEDFEHGFLCLFAEDASLRFPAKVRKQQADAAAWLLVGHSL
jgi:hypothetical protein